MNVATAPADAARLQVHTLQLADVKRALHKLKPKHSTGPDGMPPFIIRACDTVLVATLLHIFNACLNEGIFPDRWKLTRVVPVPKGGAGSGLWGSCRCVLL